MMRLQFRLALRPWAPVAVPAAHLSIIHAIVRGAAAAHLDDVIEQLRASPEASPRAGHARD